MKRSPMPRRETPMKRTPIKDAAIKAPKKAGPSKLPKPKRLPTKVVKARCDDLFSLIIRAEGKCQMCGYRCTCDTFPVSHRAAPACNLTCSHFVGRTANWTRTYEDNCTCLCRSCHARVEGNPPLHVEWFTGLRGSAVARECQRRGEMTSLNRFDWHDEYERLKARAVELGIRPAPERNDP